MMATFQMTGKCVALEWFDDRCLWEIKIVLTNFENALCTGSSGTSVAKIDSQCSSVSSSSSFVLFPVLLTILHCQCLHFGDETLTELGQLNEKHFLALPISSLCLSFLHQKLQCDILCQVLFCELVTSKISLPLCLAVGDSFLE